MSNIHRIRSNFKQGTLGANLLTTVTTIDFGSDPGFATLGTDEYIPIIIDPEGAAQGPEIVYLTAYTATQTTGTIERGKEGTSDPGVTHPSGTDWIHGPTTRDNDWAPWALSLHEPAAEATLDIDISGYEAVRIVGWLAPATDNVTPKILFSNDGGSSFRTGASDYSWVYTYRSSSGSGGGGQDGADSEIEWGLQAGNAAGEVYSFDMMVIAPSDASGYTTITGTGFLSIAAGNVLLMTFSGRVETAEVNDAIRFLYSAGNVASGRVMVYGFPAAE